MLAQANTKGMPPLSPRRFAPRLSEIKRLAAQTKTVKSSGSEGGWLLLTAPPFSLSLSHSVSPPFFGLFLSAVSHNVGVKWRGAAPAFVDGVLLCVSQCPFDLRQIALISPGPAFICL